MKKYSQLAAAVCMSLKLVTKFANTHRRTSFSAPRIIVLTAAVSALHLDRTGRHHAGISTQERSQACQQHGAGKSCNF